MRWERVTDDPRVLSDRTDAREPELLEQLDGPTEEEPLLRLPARGRLGDRLDEPAAVGRDRGERALERGTGDAPSPMALVDEDAGDPPPRLRGRIVRIRAGVLQAQTLGASVLAPTLGVPIGVEHEGGTGATRPDKRFFERTGIARTALVLNVWGAHQQPP